MSGDDNPWGDEPAWARGEEDEEEEGDEDTPTIGASHVLVMIDCNPSMFVPCIRIADDEEDEDEAMSDRSDKEENAGKEVELVTPFEAALRATEKLMRGKVNAVATSRGSRRDGVGVFLYATKKFNPDEKRDGGGDKSTEIKKADRALTSGDDDESSSDEEDDESDSDAYLTSVYELIPLAPPGTEQTLEIRGCIPGNVGSGSRVADKYRRNLASEFADTADSEDANDQLLCPLRSALHEASKAFLEAKCVKKQAATAKSPGDSKSLWIFTNKDSPCKDNDDEKKQVVMVAKDAVDNGLQINVWPLPRMDGGTFERSKFFDEITTTDYYSEHSYIETSGSFARGEVDLDDLLDDIDRSWKKVRKAQTLALFLPGWERRPANPGIMVDLIHPVQIKRKPQAFTVNQETNKRTEKKTDTLGKDGEAAGEIIDDETRLRQFAHFGGSRIPFTSEEVDLIKLKANANEETHCLILKGFKTMRSLPTLTSYTHTYLAYPNEEKVLGSRSAFTALHASMIRKDVWAIGELLLKAKKAQSRMVAMVPQAEVRDDEDGTQVQPPGIVLYGLPFEEDVRAVDDDSGYIADNDLVDKAVELLRHQQLRGVVWGQHFENPALTVFWNYIESIAIDIPQQPHDNDLEKDPNEILEIAGDQIAQLKLALPEDEVKTKGRKRKAPTVDDSGIDWRALYDSDEISGCTIPNLKKYLGSVGEKLGGKKSDLVGRVQDSITQRISAGTMPVSANETSNDNDDANGNAEGNGTGASVNVDDEDV